MKEAAGAVLPLVYNYLRCPNATAYAIHMTKKHGRLGRIFVELHSSREAMRRTGKSSL